MNKRFLNISYKDKKTRINITEMEDLRELHDEIKERFGEDIPAPAADIQVSEEGGNLIEDLEDIDTLPVGCFAEGGGCLEVKLQSPKNDQMSSCSERKFRKLNSYFSLTFKETLWQVEMATLDSPFRWNVRYLKSYHSFLPICTPFSFETVETSTYP
jgi:hypothetical protein